MLCEGRWDNSPGMPFAEKREEERQMTIGMVLALLCGLALFLYGVTLLGDGLNKIAGGKFEAILARLIGSPVKSVLIGAVFSAIVQSSTATSIIAIGFLNSGMMQLSQAAYMILGSILGSSVTGWIVSLTSLGTGGGLTEVLSVANLTALVAIAGIFLRKFRRGARENNIGNILFNSLGIANLAFGGKAIFDTDNLTFVYKGGLRDKIFSKERAWGSFAVFGNNNLYPPTESKYSDLYSHELHHLWQSRAMGVIFIPNYVSHGLTSLIGRGNFIETMNFYEQIGYFHHWYE